MPTDPSDMCHADYERLASDLGLEAQKYVKERDEESRQLEGCNTKLPQLKRQKRLLEATLTCKVAASNVCGGESAFNQKCVTEEERTRDELTKVTEEIAMMEKTTIPTRKENIVALNAILTAIRAAELEASGRAVALFDAETEALEKAEKEAQGG